VSLDLDERSGWPEELLALLKRHPRSGWRHAPSAVARFWLERHDAFRRHAAELDALIGDYRAERLGAGELAMRVAPRLQSLLGELHGHHQIEDFHYFPHFRTAEPRLTRGFDALGKDHETLHASIESVIEGFNALAAAVGSGTGAEAERSIAQAFAEASITLHCRLVRHLDDEEDLIIPVMLERDLAG
jgi:hypothetical protein